MHTDAPTSKASRIAAALATVVLLGAGLGLLGYYLGRDSAESKASARTTEAKPEPKPEREEEPAPAPAETPAQEPGRTYEQGLRKGRAQGHELALSLDRFEFAPGTFYVVQFAGSGEDDLRIDTSARMEPGRSYLLCNTNDLCAQ